MGKHRAREACRCLVWHLISRIYLRTRCLMGDLAADMGKGGYASTGRYGVAQREDVGCWGARNACLFGSR